MKDIGLFPEDDITKDLSDGGLYPDTQDPNFVARLLKKTEFADTFSFPLSKTNNPCAQGPGFEVTPVQRFVGNFLHPRTPYMSMLLYHGVGVGKTCAAIQASEAYLDVYPRRKVIIVAPPNIQAGFLRTIFDPDSLTIGQGDIPNSAIGCTGDTYLRLSNCVFQKDKEYIVKRIRQAIKRRYEFFGYLQFRNEIRKVIKQASHIQDEAQRKLQEIDLLKRVFNYRMVIIDEAHNLRDILEDEPEKEEEEETDTAAEDEKNEAKAGKQLTPFLKYLLESTDGIKLLLMTATPMFNSVFEITFLLNLLLMNDKKATISTNQILDEYGTILPEASKILKPIANAYVSFMRGENPMSFPLRLYPEGLDPNGMPISRLTKETYPQNLLTGKAVPIPVKEEDKERMSKLPIIISDSIEGSLSDKVMSALTLRAKNTNYMIIDSLLQGGNCVYPTPGSDGSQPELHVGLRGFNSIFTKEGKGVYRASDASWLAEDQISQFSPKGATVLRHIKHSEGVCFYYSRFVISGALFMAHLLEANGYTPYNRPGYLANGIQSPGGRQCAFCPRREYDHTGSEHGPFVPAKFILLTGDKELSPKNAEVISVARSEKNLEGGVVKVVLGSQIAGEGLDLRFIRQNHIFDAWFHLNKTEQIIGRAIRFCSHSMLDELKRNTTVYLHVLRIPSINKETADITCYRRALIKAIQVGQVSRQLKVHAIDCNLRNQVTVLRGLGTRIQRDSLGQDRKGADGKGVSLDDTDFTVMCDWMECEYKCDPQINVDLDISDDSTYDAFSAQHRQTQLKRIIQAMFTKQPFYAAEELLQDLIATGIPRIAIDMTIQSIVNNKLFRLKVGPHEGYIIYKNKYFLFQPYAYQDTRIPIALRIADFPVKRDEYTPKFIERDTKPIEIQEEIHEPIKKEFWSAITKWVDAILQGRLTRVTIEIERQIELYTPDFKQQRVAYLDKLSMIALVSKRIPAEHKMRFRYVILEYLWDEWLDIKTQYRYCLTPDEDINEIGKENMITSGTYKAYRFVNPETNFLQYLCDDGKPCPSGIIDALSKLDRDEYITRTADVETTGDIYGFNVPKRGVVVFKSHNPHAKGAKPKGGQECIIVTSKEYMKKLVTVGEQMVHYGFSSLDFDAAHLSVPGEISNSVRGCTILNLLLRYMDSLRMGGKRWFFRPISAYYSNHRGLVTAEAKKLAESSMKELKEAEKAAKKQQKKGEREQLVAAKKAATVAVKVQPAKPGEPAKPKPGKQLTLIVKPKKPAPASIVATAPVEEPASVQPSVTKPKTVREITIRKKVVPEQKPASI